MRRCLAPTLATLTLLGVASAWAGPAEDLVEARRLIKNVQDEEAIVVLSRAIDRGDTSPAQRAEIYLWMRALESVPDLTCPKLAPPKTRELFEQVSKALREAAAKPAPPLSLPPPKVEPEPANTVPPEALAASRPPTARRIGGAAVAVAGAVAVVVGALLVTDGLSLRDQSYSERNVLDSQSLFSRAQSRFGGGIGLLATGAVLVAGGTALAAWPAAASPGADAR